MSGARIGGHADRPRVWPSARGRARGNTLVVSPFIALMKDQVDSPTPRASPHGHQLTLQRGVRRTHPGHGRRTTVGLRRARALQPRFMSLLKRTTPTLAIDEALHQPIAATAPTTCDSVAQRTWRHPHHCTHRDSHPRGRHRHPRPARPREHAALRHRLDRRTFASRRRRRAHRPRSPPPGLLRRPRPRVLRHTQARRR